MNEIENIDGKRFTREFETIKTFAENLALGMSEKVGWKNRNVPIDMTDFPHYRMKIDDYKVSLLSGNVDVASVILSEGKIRLESNTMNFKDLDEFCSKITDLCLSAENIDYLRKFTHKGVELIFCLQFNDRYYAPIPQYDIARRELAKELGDITFTDKETFLSSCVEYAYGGQIYYVDEYPEMKCYFFDGLHISNIVERQDCTIWQEFKKDCLQIRDELNIAAGLEPGLFLYDDVIFPLRSYTDIDISLSLVRNHTDKDALFTLGTYDGKLTMISHQDKVKKYFSSKDQAVAFVRKIVLSKENIAAAKREAQAYKRVMEQQTKRSASSKK